MLVPPELIDPVVVAAAVRRTGFVEIAMQQDGVGGVLAAGGTAEEIKKWGDEAKGFTIKEDLEPIKVQEFLNRYGQIGRADYARHFHTGEPGHSLPQTGRQRGTAPCRER